jgi:glycosyltransferase involved in cell wall biosynthesis
MKILIANWQDIRHPLAGGAEVHLHEVFSRIVRMGHEVTLVCSRFPGSAPQETIDGIHVIRRGGRNFFNFRFFIEYLRVAGRGRFDLLVDDMNKIPFFTPLFATQPVQGVVHHLFGKSIFLEVNVLLAPYVYLAERLAVWLYKRRRVPFIVGSPSTEAELVMRGFERQDVVLIPYGVDHAKHRLTGVPQSPTPLIAYFGRLKKYKSVDHLLHALPSVLGEVPSLRVLVIGEGDDRGRLEAIAKDYGLSGAVEFTGFVSEEKKIELLQQIWFKVTTSSKEGWGLTVLEANACGTPVLASNVPGLRDAVRDGETGLLYTYGDTKDLAEKMLRLLTDEGLRRRMAAQALEWAKKFDWDDAARKTLSVIERRAKTLPPQ